MLMCELPSQELRIQGSDHMLQDLFLGLKLFGSVSTFEVSVESHGLIGSNF